MPRTARIAPGGMIQHVLNRGSAGVKLFRRPADYEDFIGLLAEAQRHCPMRVLGFCLMPDHWHLVLWPYRDGDLSEFMRWLANTHVRRFRQHDGRYPGGRVYRGRFRNFPVQGGRGLLAVLRYVERGPVRHGLAARPQDWLWSSLTRRTAADGKRLISALPVPRPPNWHALVNRPLDDGQLHALRTCVARGRPFGDPAWVQQTVRKLGLQFTLRPRGRPPKVRPKGKAAARG